MDPLGEPLEEVLGVGANVWCEAPGRTRECPFHAPYLHDVLGRNRSVDRVNVCWLIEN